MAKGNTYGNMGLVAGVMVGIAIFFLDAFLQKPYDGEALEVIMMFLIPTLSIVGFFVGDAIQKP